MKRIAIITIFILAFSIPASAQQKREIARQPEPFRGFNLCVETLHLEGDFETGLWAQLREQLVEMRDEPRIVPAQFMETVDRLIKLHEQRLTALRRMLKHESK